MTHASRRAPRRLRLVPSDPIRALRELTLTVGAVLGVLCLLSGTAAVTFGIKPIVFESGSMSPAIDTGALAISRTVPASDLKVGDVVTVRTSGGVRVTHRVQDIAISGEKATLILKGDDNRVADDEAYVVGSAPRVLFDIPKAGYVTSFLTGPVGIFGGGLLVGLVVLTIFRPAAPKRPDRSNRQDRNGGRTVVTSGLVLLVGLGAMGSALRPTSTTAYYTDTVRATSGIFSAKAVPVPPSGPACVLNGSVLTFRIDAVAGATGYDFSYGVSASSQTVIHVAPGGSASVDISTLDAGVYLTSVTAIGTGPGLGVSTSLSAFTVVKVLNLPVLSVAVCLNLDLHIPLGRGSRPAGPAAQAPAASDPSAPSGGSVEQPGPVEEVEPPAEPAPAAAEPDAPVAGGPEQAS